MKHISPASRLFFLICALIVYLPLCAQNKSDTGYFRFKLGIQNETYIANTAFPSQGLPNQYSRLLVTPTLLVGDIPLQYQLYFTTEDKSTTYNLSGFSFSLSNQLLKRSLIQQMSRKRFIEDSIHNRLHYAPNDTLLKQFESASIEKEFLNRKLNNSDYKNQLFKYRQTINGPVRPEDSTQLFEARKAIKLHEADSIRLINANSFLKTYADNVSRQKNMLNFEARQRTDLLNGKPSALRKEVKRNKVGLGEQLMLSVETFDIGRIFPYYTSFTLNGVGLDGINTGLTYGAFKLSGVWGKYFQSSNNYQNELWASQLTVGNQNKHLAFTYLTKINKEKSTPASNEVLSTLVKLPLGKGINWEGEAAYSATNYLPDHQETTSLSIQKSLKRANLATTQKIYFLIPLTNSDGYYSFSFIGPDFNSVGLGAIKTDNARHDFKLQQKIYKNILKTRIQVRHDRDNVLNTKSAQTNISNIGLEMNIRLRRKHQINSGYRNIYQTTQSKNSQSKPHYITTQQFTNAVILSYQHQQRITVYSLTHLFQKSTYNEADNNVFINQLLISINHTPNNYKLTLNGQVSYSSQQSGQSDSTLYYLNGDYSVVYALNKSGLKLGGGTNHSHSNNWIRGGAFFTLSFQTASLGQLSAKTNFLITYETEQYKKTELTSLSIIWKKQF